MKRVLHLLRSDLVLSIIGGFALGIAGMSLVKPASADVDKDRGRAVTVSVPDGEIKSAN
jgi:hypothetical protein